MKTNTQQQNSACAAMTLMGIVLCTLLLCASLHANTQSPTLKNIQLAYFIGYHSYTRNPGINPVPAPQVIKGAHWTQWQSTGNYCQKKCLVDDWTGLIIQCQRRC
ncbi:hypothetical protein [Legionella worsleiensis]|uniref:Uncharacterized protein n=1 Tax=Legionella worsleiensis TaxID=45076 RepID=A0A0W1A6I6_9GAMM|nr:hypothetical protein [Legionella worsleiensis]KTD76988.1 hypothetical protein Lwor_2213 [Legionella worsleiensis]STY33339.1 Uncharacterised protein [Legionella worsleiensis]